MGGAGKLGLFGSPLIMVGFLYQAIMEMDNKVDEMHSSIMSISKQVEINSDNLKFYRERLLFHSTRVDSLHVQVSAIQSDVKHMNAQLNKQYDTIYRLLSDRGATRRTD